MISDALTPEMQRHLLLLVHYMKALSSGDLETARRILAAAEQDAVLSRMLIEADILYQEQQLSAVPDVEQTEADRLLVSSLLGRLDGSGAYAHAASEPLQMPRRPTRRGRGLLGGLAAVLLAVFLLGSFLAVLRFYYHGTPVAQTGYPGEKDLTQTASAVPNNPWHVVPIPALTDPLFLRGVAVISANDAWAIDSEAGRLIHWNGQQWSVIPGASVDGDIIEFTGITAIASNDVWAVGSYSTHNGPGKGVKILAEHWNGQHWSLAVNGALPVLGQLNAVTSFSSTDVWAVGDAISVTDDTPTSLFLHWNGQQWQPVSHPLMETNGPNGPNEAEFSAIMAISANDIWTVGNVSINHPTAQSANELKPAIEHWNGQQWKVVVSPDPGDPFEGLQAVSATSSNDIWTVGNTSVTPEGSDRGLIEHWDGKTWNIVPGSQSMQNMAFNGVLAVSAEDVWVVGTIYDVNQQTEKGVLEHWDGKTWSATYNSGGSNGFSCIASIPGTQEMWVIGYSFSMYGLE